jgi:hypothetical protein
MHKSAHTIPAWRSSKVLPFPYKEEYRWGPPPYSDTRENLGTEYAVHLDFLTKYVHRPHPQTTEWKVCGLVKRLVDYTLLECRLDATDSR